MPRNNLSNKIKGLLPKSAFARGVSVLVGGTVSSQALMILASPILTRLYSPENFGLLAVYASILSFFIVIASFSYEAAIPLPEKDSDAALVAVLCLFILLATSLFSVLLVMIGGDYLALKLNSPALSNYLWLLPIGIFTIGCYRIFNYWAIRTKSFSDIAKTKITQSITTLAIQLLGFKLGAVSLILGQTTGQAIGITSLARPAIKNPKFFKWRWKDLQQVARRYKDFPIFSTWGSLLNTASAQLPPILFAIFFSPAAAGLYSLAYRVLAKPLTVVGSAVGNVFFSSSADAYRNNQLNILFESVYEKLVSIILPITLILMIDAPRLFSIVFGTSWTEAGELARWMAPWLGLVFITSPLSVLFIILEKQRENLYYQLIMLLIRTLAIWVGFQYSSMLIAVQLFSSVSILCMVGFLLWAVHNCKSPFSTLILPFLKFLPLSILCIVPLIISAMFGTSITSWSISLLLTAFFVAIYYLRIIRKGFSIDI